MNKKHKKVVLAYSGGLDTSAIVPWLKENYECDVYCFVADVGQSPEDLLGVKEKALASGAKDCFVADLKEEFVADYIFPTLKTGAIYEGRYLLGTAMARPIIAKKQIEYALEIQATAIAHGCTGKGNDQVRFESAVAALAPQLDIIAPWRIWDMKSREDLLNYLQERNIETTASLTKIYSRDENAWHISTEGGELEQPWQEATKQVWTWTNSPKDAPEQSERITLGITDGVISHFNSQALNPYQLLTQLNTLGAKHGIGRIDIVENRLVGMKSRGCYETPGGTIMVQALQAIEELVLDRSMREFKSELAIKFAALVYDGRWFTPLKDAILGATTTSDKKMQGEVVIELYKGNVEVLQKRSKYSLYSESFATFAEDEVYNQKDAEGFIKLYSLPSRINALLKLSDET